MTIGMRYPNAATPTGAHQLCRARSKRYVQITGYYVPILSVRATLPDEVYTLSVIVKPNTTKLQREFSLSREEIELRNAALRANSWRLLYSRFSRDNFFLHVQVSGRCVTNTKMRETKSLLSFWGGVNGTLIREFRQRTPIEERAKINRANTQAQSYSTVWLSDHPRNVSRKSCSD